MSFDWSENRKRGRKKETQLDATENIEQKMVTARNSLIFLLAAVLRTTKCLDARAQIVAKSCTLPPGLLLCVCIYRVCGCMMRGRIF